jgi:quercetin dioxygenase-like cupin family protein
MTDLTQRFTPQSLLSFFICSRRHAGLLYQVIVGIGCAAKNRTGEGSKLSSVMIWCLLIRMHWKFFRLPTVISQIKGIWPSKMYKIPVLIATLYSIIGPSGLIPILKIMRSNRHDHSDGRELEKAIPHIIVEIIEYMENAIVSKTIIKKSTGNVIAMSFDTGEELGDKTSPFDNFIQIIDGTAHLTIDKKPHQLKPGNGIIIPAHARHCFNAREKFKMISTVIKSGFEE